MAGKSFTGVNPKLTKVIVDLLEEVTLKKMEVIKDADGNPKKDAQGKVLKKQVYSLTDVVKIIDRNLKLEALRLDIKDQGFGSGFGDDDDEETPPTTPGA